MKNEKNLRAYCIDRLGGSQRQDPEVFEDIYYTIIDNTRYRCYKRNIQIKQGGEYEKVSRVWMFNGIIICRLTRKK